MSSLRIGRRAVSRQPTSSKEESIRRHQINRVKSAQAMTRSKRLVTGSRTRIDRAKTPERSAKADKPLPRKTPKEVREESRKLRDRVELAIKKSRAARSRSGKAWSVN